MVKKIGLVSFALVGVFTVFAGVKDGAAPSFTPKKYGIKSAIITMTMNMAPGAQAAATPSLASSGTVVLSFDDNGAKESIVNSTALEIMGMKIDAKSQTIIKDGYVYIIDLTKKSATKTKILKIDDPTKLDFANASAEYIKQWNIKKEGTGVVAGKTCDVYSFKTDDIAAASGAKAGKDKIPMEGTCSVWNNIGLKAEFILNGSMNIKTEATKVDEATAIPASTFEVPEGIKVKEEKD